MSDTPTQFWMSWRSRKTAELTGDGIPVGLAQFIAQREMEVRIDASKIVGRQAALDCVVVTDFRSDGTLGVYAQVRETAIPQRYLQGALRWAERPKPKPI